MISTIRVDKGWMTIAYMDGPEVVSNSPVFDSAEESEGMIVEDLKTRHIEAIRKPDSQPLRELAARILRFDPKVPISRRGISGFRWNVLEYVRRIPKGKVASYSDVANAIGKPGAQRAVGTVMARHCLAYIIPCHRVVKNDLSPGRFSSSESKVEMLKAEGIGMDGGRIREKHRLAQGT
jgi:O-6-methylguanine DNA methyltransferase